MHSLTFLSLVTRVRVALLLLLGFAVALGSAPSVVRAADESFTSSDASGWIDRAIELDLQITGTGEDELELNLFVPQGTLSFGTHDDVNFASTTDPLLTQVRGTREALNAVLATMTYTSDEAGSTTIDVWLGIGGGDFAYNEETQHVYQVVTPESASTWTQARDLAEAATFDGLPGYLSTITTQQEHDFIRARINQNGWIGGSDADTEGVWRWMTGPEATEGDNGNFWNGDFEAGDTVAPWDFANWADGEPNNHINEGQPEGEDCAQIYFDSGADGAWNDLDCAIALPNFVIEFGTPDNLPTVVATSFDVVVTAVPDNVLALEKIQEYADTDGASSAPTVEDYEDAGIDGATADNLALLNQIIADMDPADLSEVSDLEAVLVPAIALDKIQTYADSDGASSTPTVEDYENAGISGVTADNLAEMNAHIAASEPEEVETVEEVQSAATTVAATEKIKEYAHTNGGSAEPTVEDYAAAGLTGVTNKNIEEVNQALADGGTVTDLASIQELVEEGIKDASRSSSSSSSSRSKSSESQSSTMQKLQATLATLKAKLATLVAQQGGTTPAGIQEVRDLTLRDTGADVQALQQLLIAQSQSIPAGATGYFGTQTQAALASYQAAHGIAPAAGYFGAITRTQMKAAALPGLWW